MQEFFMQTDCGCIHCCQWMPEGRPLGVVQIVHGVAEYIARYDEFAQFLAGHGYLVVGEDHPGHGKSVGEGEIFGYLTGGWMGTVKTIHLLYGKTRAEHPGIPYIMLGHSMGSFLLRTYLFTYHAELSGALISGTGWQPGALLPLGLALCREEAARLGEANSSPLIQNLIFGSYNKRFAPNRTPYDWVCSREAVVDAYAADPFCTWLPTIQLCREMLSGIQMIQRKSNLDRMQKQLPVFFFAGQLDPVGSMGNGVLKAVQAFKDAGMEDVTVELYPDMRHECLNETGREKVFMDVLTWIQEKCQNGSHEK